MEKDDNKVRGNILNQVKEFYTARFKAPEFIPGTTRVRYSGRVFDEQELIELVNSGLDFWLTAGHYAAGFEKAFSAYHKVKHCALTNSGSSANLLAVCALTSPKLGEKRLKPGDEVITVAAGFPTTITPIIQNNLVPVFVDIEPDTLNIAPGQIEAAVSEKTRAVFIAHTLGNPFDIDTILKIKKKHDLWLIEDVCDALGSRYDGRLAGTFGDIATFSFYPAHHITMGEGGALLTKDTQLYRNILSFRDWGRDCWCEPGHNNTCGRRFKMQLGDLPKGYDHKFTYSHLGYNLKITDMQAAVGIAQLKKLNWFIQKRKENYQRLYDFFNRYAEWFILPRCYSPSDPSWFGFFITLRKNAPFTRQEVVTHLDQHLIDTRMLFAGNMIKQPAFKDVSYRVSGNLDNTDYVMNNTFWLGVYPGLDQQQMDYIIRILEHFFSNYRGQS